MDQNYTQFTPAMLNQLLTVRAGQILAKELPEVAGGLIRVSGKLSDPGQARGPWHYDVRLSDDGGRIHIDIPAPLVSARRLKAGQQVIVTGALRVRVGQLGNLELRVEASEIEFTDWAALRAAALPATSDATDGKMSLEDIKRLGVTKHHFPVTSSALRITLIQSASVQAMVSEDCMAELSKLGNMVTITKAPINILSSTSIADALRHAGGDIVMLIRGGGPAADFEVFDDSRVVEALASVQAYRVIGLGHSANSTLLDHVADFTARTPAQAGLHVREMVVRQVAEWKRQQARSIASPVVHRHDMAHGFIAFLRGLVSGRA